MANLDEQPPDAHGITTTLCDKKCHLHMVPRRQCFSSSRSSRGNIAEMRVDTHAAVTMISVPARISCDDPSIDTFPGRSTSTPTLIRKKRCGGARTYVHPTMLDALA